MTISTSWRFHSKIDMVILSGVDSTDFRPEISHVNKSIVYFLKWADLAGSGGLNVPVNRKLRSAFAYKQSDRQTWINQLNLSFLPDRYEF